MTKTKKTKTVRKKSLADIRQTRIDFMTALLIVSLTVNLFVLVGWVTLQVTDVYDDQVKSFLFSR